jgi:lysophospholipase L1-like esterase
MAAIPVGNIPSTIASYDTNEASASHVASEHLSGSVTGRAITRQVLPPLAIRGRPVSSSSTPNPGILLLVDSNGVGPNDSTTGTGYTGMIQRGIGTQRPWTNAGQAGYAMYAAVDNAGVTADLLRKLSVLGRGGIKYVFVMLSGNDVKDGSTATEIYAKYLTLRDYLAPMGVRMVVTTGQPRTNSSNTGPNESDAPGAMDQVLALNDLIRASNGVGYGYFDRHAALADPANPRLYRTDKGGTLHDPDGIHCITLGHTVGAAALSPDVPRLFPAF